MLNFASRWNQSVLACALAGAAFLAPSAQAGEQWPSKSEVTRFDTVVPGAQESITLAPLQIPENRWFTLKGLIRLPGFPAPFIIDNLGNFFLDNKTGLLLTQETPRSLVVNTPTQPCQPSEPLVCSFSHQIQVLYYSPQSIQPLQYAIGWNHSKGSRQLRPVWFNAGEGFDANRLGQPVQITFQLSY